MLSKKDIRDKKIINRELKFPRVKITDIFIMKKMCPKNKGKLCKCYLKTKKKKKILNIYGLY